MAKSGWDKAKALWTAWVRLARRIGHVQARVLLTMLYAVVLLPFGICVGLFADVLRTKVRPTKWLGRVEQSADINWARKQ
jgi:hypothetical protein